MSVTIHSHHQVSDEMKDIIDGIGSASLRGEYKQEFLLKQ